MSTHKIALHVGLQGACGYPLPLFSGYLGKRGSIICHCASVNPSNLPIIFTFLLKGERSYKLQNKIPISEIGS